MFCLAILVDLDYSNFFGFNLELSIPFFKKGQLPSFSGPRQ